MSERDKANPNTEEESELLLEWILEEYRQPPAPEPHPAVQGSPARRIELTAEEIAAETAAGEFDSRPPVPRPATRPVRQPVHWGQVLDLHPARAAEPEPARPTETASAPEPAAEELPERDTYAPAGDYARPTPEPRPEKAAARTLSQRLMAPVVGLLAAAVVRRHQRTAHEDAARKQADQENARAEDIPAEAAARRWGAQIRPLRRRGRIAGGLCLPLLLLTYLWCAGVALPGFLGRAESFALVCLILELGVMLTAADVCTYGLTSLVKGHPGAETLVVLSCLASCADAVLVAAGRTECGIPFCGASALSAACMLWGMRLTCTGYRRSFRAVARGKQLWAVAAEPGLDQEGTALRSLPGDARGFVSRSLEDNLGDRAYRRAAPIFLVLSLLLALFAWSLGGGETPGRFVHILSACLSACAAFSGGLCFAMPFAAAALTLRRSGAALAGWTGCREVGKSRSTVVTDEDLFPQGSLTITGIRVVESLPENLVIAAAGSVMCASGSAAAPLFSRLMLRNGCSMQRVDNFTVHEGGGLVAMVNGQTVMVGSSGFMDLMGVRLPQSVREKNAVYAALSGSLAAIFSIEYKAADGVRGALLTLLHNDQPPYFAVRDFNITPLLITQKYRIFRDDLNFPAYADRYRVSAGEREAEVRPAALMTRGDLRSLSDVGRIGRRMYQAVRLGVLFALLSGGLGLAFMFLLCRAGAWDTATAANLLTFMLLWLIPQFLVLLGLKN